MLNINANSLDSCAVMAIASVSTLYTSVSVVDFFGLEYYYGLHLPPVVDSASILLTILGFWAFCRFVNRVAFGSPNR